MQATYSSGILCGHMPAPRTHKCDCLKQQQSVPRALGFPSELRGFCVKSLHTQPTFLQSHMQACRLSVCLSGVARGARTRVGILINFCFLRLLLLLLKCSPDLSSSPRLPFWQLFLMLTKLPVDRILLPHCGFLSLAISPPQTQAHHPLLLFLFPNLLDYNEQFGKNWD